MKTVSYLALLSLIVASTYSTALAEISWQPTQSTYNSKAFVSYPPVPMPGVPSMGATNEGGSNAYGLGINTSNTYILGFLNGMPSNPSTISFPETELGSTALSAGTILSLVFTKGASDRINYIALLADGETTSGNQILKYEVVDSTTFRLTAKVVNPVASASGDAAAAFGLFIDYQSDTNFDFKTTVFVTDMHYLDISAPTQTNSGLAGIAATGVNGSEAHFYGFMPLAFVSAIGVNPNDTAALTNEIQGYMDLTQVSQGAFLNKGPDSALGFNFADSGNPSNTVVVLKISNSTWSKHNMQFRKKSAQPSPTPTATPTSTPTPTATSIPQDTTAPTVTIAGKLSRTVTAASSKIIGVATDDSQVSTVEYSLKSAKSGFKSVKLKNGGYFSFTISKLVKKKTVKAYVRATDAAGNISIPVVVKVKRK